ncbi:peptidoglycan-binding domain-containing protein [Pseudomonas sp. CGJS7]|uniref:peptidoglycan-binding domain-containing protein n=1 Tax=Pseudomonas sp. CGJS7 TaxID=3109348 RepID=UPI0030086486
MPKYTIVESVGKGVQHVHDLEDIERHHPSRGNEPGRVYGTVNGEREELLGSGGKPMVTRDGDHFVSKDFVLKVGNSASVPVPAVANGYIGKIDPANGIVQIYDKPASDPSREMIAQYRHMELHGTKLQVGQKIEYGESLGVQSGYNKGKSDAFGKHVHIDINTSYLPQMDRYIRDMDSGALTTDKRPPHADNRTGPAKVGDVSAKGSVTHSAPGGGHSHTAPGGHSQAAMADGVLRKDERGPEVKALQERLTQLGYKDAEGKPLVADGKFGQRTKDAVEAFQRDHGLTDDGIAGKNTLRELKSAQPKHAATEPARTHSDAANGPLLSDAAHPDNGMYKQAVAGLEKLGGFKNHQELERAAASLTYDARASGLTEIKHVVANASGTGLFAVQGELNDPASHRAFINKESAVQQTVEQSTQRLKQDVPEAAKAEPAQSQTPKTMVA